MRTTHGMGQRYHWVSRTAGRLPFTPSKVEIKANGHVRDRLHALLDFHVEIETAAFPSQVLFPTLTGPSTPSKEGRGNCYGWPSRTASHLLLLLTATPRSHWRARELRRLLPELLAWSIFGAFPLTLV
ncbi:hypothetical protein HDV57DRAFT_23777 [Trichoderma longibrachiatum]